MRVGDRSVRPLLLFSALLLVHGSLMIGGTSDAHGRGLSPPGAPSALQEEARKYEAEQRLPEAIEAYREFLLQRPEDDEARAALARVLSWQGEYAESADLYRDILSRHPVDSESRTALARVLSWQQQTAEARALYEAVLYDHPEHVEALQGLADLLRWTGHSREALRRYHALFILTGDLEIASRIVTLQRDVAYASDEEQVSHARALATSGQYDEAAREYRAVLSRHPADPEVQVALARVLAWQQQFDEAERLYGAALAAVPGHPEAQRGLADMLSWARRPSEALPLYEALYRASPDSDLVERIEALKAESLNANRSRLVDQVARAREQARNQRYDEAIEGYRRVLVQDPGHIEAKQGLADTLYWSGRYQEALNLYEGLYEQTNDPDLPQRMQAVRSELSARAPVSRGPGLAIPYRDYLKVGYSHYAYTNNVPDERNALIEAATPLGNMTVVGRVEPLNRFGLHDTPVSGEVYSPLWSHAWGYVGGTAAINAQFAPTWSMGGELFQGLGSLSSRWSFVELSAGYRRVTFKSTDIDLLTPGLTIYLPWNIWLTEKIFYVPRQGSITASTQLTWRPTDRLQLFLSGAYGTSGERIVAVQDFIRVKSIIWQGGILFPITERLSGEAAAYYEDRGFLYVRRGGTFNLIWHW